MSHLYQRVRLTSSIRTRLAGACLLIAACGLAACGGSSSTPPAAPPGPQSVELAVDITAGTVTVTSPASHLAVSGTATDDGGGTATVVLSLLSNYPRLLFNLKGVSDDLSDGTAAGDGLFMTRPYIYFGPEALAPGAMDTASFTFSGLGGTTFTMTVDFYDHPSLFVNGNSNGGPILSVDSSGSGEVHPIDTDPLAFQKISSGQAGNQGGCVSPDGRYLYLAPRNQPGIIMVDLTTFMPTMGADLSGGTIAFDATGSVGFLDDVLLSPDGQYLYALLTVGSHSFGNEGSDSDGHGGGIRRAATNDVHVVKLNRATLAEVGRATLATGLAQVGGESQVGKGLSLSPSGGRLAACIRNGGLVFVVQTAGMTIYDADLMVGGAQGFDTTSIGDQPRRSVFRGENELYVGFSGDGVAAGGTNDGTLLTVDIGARSTGMLAPSADYVMYDYNYMGALKMMPDGRLLILHPYDVNNPAIAVYDFGTAMWTTAFSGMESFHPTAVSFSADGTQMYVFAYQGQNGPPGDSSVTPLDVATLMIVPTEADGALEMLTGAQAWGHTCIITPF